MLAGTETHAGEETAGSSSLDVLTVVNLGTEGQLVEEVRASSSLGLV